jgi:ATP-dependent Lon protease
MMRACYAYALHHIQDPFVLADFGATLTTADAHRLQDVLESMDIEDRLQKSLLLLTEVSW